MLLNCQNPILLVSVFLDFCSVMGSEPSSREGTKSWALEEMDRDRKEHGSQRKAELGGAPRLGSAVGREFGLH